MTDRVCEKCHLEQKLWGFICEKCRSRLHNQLVAMPGLLDELDVELMKRSVKGGAAAARGGTASPAPINLDAADLLDRIRRFLWRSTALIRQGHRPPANATPRQRVRALTAQLSEMVLTPGVVEFSRECDMLHRKATIMIDLPLERVGIGTCTCGAKLIAGRNGPDEIGHRKERLHACRDCGSEWAVEASLRSIEEIAERDFEEHLLTPAQIEAATGKRIKATRVRKWVEREKVTQDEHHRIRFGDVLDVEQATQRGAA